MKRLYQIVPAAVLGILLGLAVSASAEERVTHSGSIFSIADDATTFVLAEVGPWEVWDGATVITYRTITLTPETEFALVTRADRAPSGFAGDFVEIQLAPEGIHLNDYITVECRHEGTRLVALKIIVTERAAETEGTLLR